MKETKKTIRTLIASEDLQRRIGEIAQDIKRDYTEKTITLICILKGGVMFMTDLARKLDLDVELDFMDISSYGDETVSSGTIRIEKDLEHSITGKHVLLIEDIIDTGRTLTHLQRHLLAQSPASLKICTLLNKPSRRVADEVVPDYVGFVIPDEFVVGFGLDYAQKYRNLPYIGVLDFEE